MSSEQKPPAPRDHRSGYGQTAYKRRLAYAHLGIDPKDVDHVPFFAADLRRIARVARGVDRCDPPSPTVRPLDYLRSSEDPEARKVLKAYDSVPESYPKLLPLEAFSVAAGSFPMAGPRDDRRCRGTAGRTGSAIIAAVMHPRVVIKTVERALQDGGTKERQMLFSAMGSLRT